MKGLPSTLKNNSFYTVLDQFLALSVGLVITVTLARYFGPEEFGRFTYVISLTGIVNVFTNLGIQTLLRREVAKEDDGLRNYIGQAWAIRFIISLPISIIIVHLIGYLFNFSFSQLILVHFANLFTFLSGFLALNVGAFLSLHLGKKLFLYNLFFRVSSITALFLVVFFSLNLTNYLVLLSLGLLLVILASCFNFLKIDKSINIIPNLNKFKYIIYSSLPLMFAAAIEFMNLKIDTLILAYYQGEEVLGYYSAAFSIFIAFVMIPLAITKVFFTNFIQTFYKGLKEEASRLFKVISFSFLIYSLLCSIFLLFFSESLISLLFGNGYLYSNKALSVLGWVLPFIILNRLFLYLLVALGKSKIIVIVNSFGLGLNVILNFILIPKYSLVGAALATGFSEGIVLFIGLWFLLKALKQGPKKNNYSTNE